jgi:RNA polymerase sigma factor (sigma-70 family)
MERNELFIKEFKPHLAELYRSALRLTLNKVDAEELVATTVQKVLEHMDRYEPGTNPLAYMRTIARNTFLNDRKKIKSRKTQLVEEEYMLQFDDADELALLDLFGNLMDRYDTFSDEVLHAIEQISNDGHFSVFCRVMDGFKSHEIAEELKMPENTVKGIVRRIRLKLIPALRDYALVTYGITPDIKMQQTFEA